MSLLRWQKVYRGPFEKAEARALAKDLRAVANPDKNLIYDARVRSRPHGKGFDVYIRTTKD